MPVAVDLGYGWTKAIAGDRQFLEPSVAGASASVIEGIGAPKGIRYWDPDGQEYFIGRMAVQQSHVPWHSLGDDKPGNPNTTRLLRTALACVAPYPNGPWSVDYLVTGGGGQRVFPHLRIPGRVELKSGPQLASTVRTGLEIVRFLLTLPGARDYDRKGFLAEALKAGLIALPVRAQAQGGVEGAAPRTVPEAISVAGDPERDRVEAQIDDQLGIRKD